MYTEVMKKSLDLNKAFVSNISKEELMSLMSEFDHHDNNSWFESSGSLNNYLHDTYRKYELFKSFKNQERKSISFKQNIIKKNPNKVLFLF